MSIFPLSMFIFLVCKANETGGSQQKELEGCKRYFGHLKDLGLTLSLIATWAFTSGFVSLVKKQNITLISGMLQDLQPKKQF